METGRLFLRGILYLMLAALPQYAQIGLAEAEEVYGGRIQWIDAAALNNSTSLVFISTESANSLFYAEVDHSGATPVYSDFQTVVDADTNDGFGKSIQRFSAASNGWVYMISNRQLWRLSTDAGSISQIEPHGVIAVLAHENFLFYLREESGGYDLHFGELDPTSGAFSEDTGSPQQVTGTSSPQPQGYELVVNPANDQVYVFTPGNPPAIYASSDDYSSLSASTVFNSVDVSGLGSSYHYQAFDIGPDGRIFAGTAGGVEPNHGKYIGYSDDNGSSWNSFSTTIGGTNGANIRCAGSDSLYYVYFGTAMSSDRGNSGTWTTIANSGFETHPNDGPVAVDPNAPSVIFMSTDQGIGSSANQGHNIYEINEGVEAVQVNDFDMNNSKTIGWTASKSGIRRVSGYRTDAESWTTSFPNGDGSPYFSIAMDTSDVSGNTAYAGNVRVYKTSDGGNSWSRIFDTQDPSHGFDFWSYVSAIAIHPQNNQVLVVGVNSARASGVTGAVFISGDGGSTWDRADTVPFNTEVRDFMFRVDGDTTVIYIGCEYVSDGTTSSYGVKRLIHDDASGALTFENDMPGETGSNITNFGAHSLARNNSGVVFAAGRRGASLEPRVYQQESGADHWEQLPTANLPESGEVSALTIGIDGHGNEVPYIAIGADIYYLESGSSWRKAYTYPTGMDINVLFWDELLVGTGTGLYAHNFTLTSIDDEPVYQVPDNYRLYQNFPNPFNPVTTIQYDIGSPGHVQLEIFSVSGAMIGRPVNGFLTPGSYSFNWEPGALPSGVYFYRLKAVSESGQVVSLVRKLVFMR